MRRVIGFCLEGRRKIVTIALGVLLIFGLCAYSVTLFVLNRTLNPQEIAGNFELLELRLSLRIAAERICSICTSLYLLGHLVLFNYTLIKKKPVPIPTTALYATAQIVIMFVCTVPFALMDMGSFADYVFPVWGTAISLSALTILYIPVCFWATKRKGYLTVPF
ncbi:hypothetical protein LJC60_01205 [Ruminococcaceae bacterium OttesenSCG-928-D13]|nr:hypothetical protein [Ruminococcaceae bacterium OttesenSCG-928-D13]